MAGFATYQGPLVSVTTNTLPTSPHTLSLPSNHYFYFYYLFSDLLFSFYLPVSIIPSSYMCTFASFLPSNVPCLSTTPHPKGAGEFVGILVGYRDFCIAV